ncbi:MAG: acetolactate synthase [Phycisphaerae bacterium]|nr:acetolactate synthase [Phycisphaerae bacterium]
MVDGGNGGSGFSGSIEVPSPPGSPGSPGSPVEFLTERGYGPPLCTQFSVFLDNRVGRLHSLLEVFDGQPIRIVALSVVDASDYAVVRIVTTRAARARLMLRDERQAYTESELLVVELGPDQRMTQLSLALLAAELNIDYAYPLMARPHGAPTMAVHTDDPVLAGQILHRKGFGLVSETQLHEAVGGDPPIA